jgi:hypothetical protein
MIMKKKLMLMLAAAVVFSLGTVLAAQGDANAGEAKRKAAREGRAATKEKTDATKEKAQAARTAARENAGKKRDAAVDKRQDNQSKRIQQGIKKGYLTPEETKSLQTQQQKIATMESTYKSDGKLTKDECVQLKDALNVASANIWAEKHDTDGKQMATYRLGKNIYAKDSLTGQLSNQNLTGAEAKALTSDFRKMLALKNSLANDNLSAEALAQKQAEYNTLLNKYFEVR